MKHRNAKLLLVAAGFYGMLAVLMMNVLALRATSAVPAGSQSDYFQFYWNFWWTKYALFSLRQPVFWTDYLHVPFHLSLAYHTLTLSWFPVYLALQLLLGRILAFNAIIWLTLTLNGFVTFLFLREEGWPTDLSLVASLLPVTAEYFSFHLWQSHLNLLAFFWLPATLLLWRRVAITRRWTWALALGVGFWLMWLTDSQWLIWSPLILVPFGVMTLVQAPDRRAR